jgi:N,N'-diacetyllegionaminate synthase
MTQARTRTLIIAEAGVNHNGDLELAKRLVDVAAQAGADLVKFQTFDAKRLATMAAGKAAYQSLTTGVTENQQQMLQRLELTPTMHKVLVEHCARRKIGFFSTAFDIESVDLLASLGQDRFKIPSGEITNLPYLRHIGELRKPVILSTGMATMEEIEAAILSLERAGTPRALVTVLHCTTEYPAPMDEVNLRAMQSMGRTFGVAIGYSDHTDGIEVAIAAVALGATIIEKHFTLDRNMAGPDHAASLEPAELASMIRGIRNIELALGDGIKRVGESEARNRPIVRKSIVARRPIKIGERFNSENVTTKRPATGLSPMRWDDVLGAVATRSYEQDDQIE